MVQSSLISRGVRNNNPFNIKRSQIVWVGEIPDSQKTDKVFEQFKSLNLGLRAGIKLLRNYVRKGFNTPEKIISRFAPSSENNTKAYINYLVKQGFCKSSTLVLDIASFDFYHLLCGILYYESKYVLDYDTYSLICRKL